jgi:hypothetical protein
MRQVFGIAYRVIATHLAYRRPKAVHPPVEQVYLFSVFCGLDEGTKHRLSYAFVAEIENLEQFADIGENQLPLSLEEGLARDTEGLDLLTNLELRAGETADPLVASDEGAAYVPPIDPRVIPGAAGSTANAEIASGLGVSALDEPYDEWHHSSFLPDDGEVSARVRDALRADSSTWQYADTIAIETHDGLVILRGMVDDLIDNDNLLAVASNVAGVTEVVDALQVRVMQRRTR